MKAAILLVCMIGGNQLAADVIAPIEDACGNKSVGAECELDGRTGVCATSTCSRLDYSKGTPPGSISYQCLKCAVQTDQVRAAGVNASEVHLGDSQPEAQGCSSKNGDLNSAIPLLSLACGLMLLAYLRRARA